MPGFADKIKAATDISDSGGKSIFITGAPGAGKTTFISTLCDIPEYKGRLLMLNCGGGISSLADRSDIAVTNVDKWSVMKEAYDYLFKSEHPYRAVAIDLAPEVYSVGLAEVVAEGSATKQGRPTLEARGIMNDRFVQMVRDYRVLSERKGIHVIYTSHTTETKDDDNGMILVRANLTPGTLSSVLGIVDVAAYMDIKKGRRQMYLVGNERIWAKTRKPRSKGTVQEILIDPTFEKLFAELA